MLSISFGRYIGSSMSVIEVNPRDGCINVGFSSPVLTLATLRELATRLARLATCPAPKPLVVTSSHPGIFLAGADLSEIATLDPHSSMRYAKFGRKVLGALQGYPAPTVAAVDGSCSGGGFDLVLACDAAIASPSATFSHPGVMRGLITGWGGTVDVPRRLGRAAARGALLEGARLHASRLLKAGVVHAVTDTPVADAYRCAHRLTDLHSSRLRLWRSLRCGIGSARLHALLTHGIIG